MAGESRVTQRTAESGIPVGKFRRLVSYLDEMGLDGHAIAGSVGIERGSLAATRERETVPALFYGLLYNAAVERLQQGEVALPWGAGIGGTAFRLMTWCVLSARRLGEALQRAAEFDTLVSPQLKGDRIVLTHEGDTACLHYHYRLLDAQVPFVPRSLRGGELPLVVGRASGLTVWHAFCGWLTGRALALKGAGIAATAIPSSYRQRLTGIFGCPVEAVDGESWIRFDAAQLEHRLVHDAASLEELLRTGPYQLLRMQSAPASTSAAIRSLLGQRFSEGLPGFEDIAARLGMSASSLRRRLMAEETSYQKLKDDCRRDAAIRLLQAGRRSVSDIAEELGFTETSSFIRSFRGWTGTTPSAFRETTRATTS